MHVYGPTVKNNKLAVLRPGDAIRTTFVHVRRETTF